MTKVGFPVFGCLRPLANIGSFINAPLGSAAVAVLRGGSNYRRLEPVQLANFGKGGAVAAHPMLKPTTSRIGSVPCYPWVHAAALVRLLSSPPKRTLWWPRSRLRAWRRPSAGDQAQLLYQPILTPVLRKMSRHLSGPWRGRRPASLLLSIWQVAMPSEDYAASTSQTA